MSDRRVAWVRAQLDATEAAANALLMATKMLGRKPDYYGCGGPAAESHFALHDPAAVLADVEAKRALLDSHYDYGGVCTRCFDWQNKPVQREPFPCEVVRLLAEGFRGRPGYEEAISGE